MQSPKANLQSPHPVESALALLGAVAGLVITIVLWTSVSYYQPTWPLPGLYFVEIAALSVVSAVAFVRGRPLGGIIIWAAVGILGAFSLLGAMSVGFFYLPVTLLLGFPALAYDLRSKQPILAHVGLCLLAAVAQAIVMLALIRLL